MIFFFKILNLFFKIFIGYLTYIFLVYLNAPEWLIIILVANASVSSSIKANRE